MRFARSTAFCLVAVLAGPARVAHADVYVTAPNTTIAVKEVRALIMHDGAGNETMLREIEVETTAREGLWLTALPSRPSNIRAEPTQLLENLQDLTHTEEPHNEALRRTLFGPSVVTLLTKRNGDSEKKNRTDDDRAGLRSLELSDFSVFDGPVTSSTITHRPFLPPDLVALTERFGGIDIGVELELAAYLNRKWAIVAIIVRDPSPQEGGRAKLGPIRTDFRSPLGIYPLGLGEIVQPIKTRFYFIGKKSLVPISVEVLWDDRPWAEKQVQAGSFQVDYNRIIESEGPIDFELRERGELPPITNAHLVRGDMTIAPGRRADFELTGARDSVELPAPGGRGSAVDLFVCVLLGLTPLLYTPESWFLLWLGGRARARARREGRALGVRLWSLYAIAVGIFWLLTLDGGARIAGIIPVLVGMVQLALPYIERDPAPVRVIFKKKKAQPPKP